MTSMNILSEPEVANIKWRDPKNSPKGQNCHYYLKGGIDMKIGEDFGKAMMDMHSSK